MARSVPPAAPVASRFVRFLAVAAAAALAGCSSAGPAADPAAGAARAAAVERALPQPVRSGGLSVEEALQARRSVREFAAEPLRPAQVGQLLWSLQGVTASWGGRTAPSAGGTYPLEVYLVAGEQVLHYRPAGHRVLAWTDPRARPALEAAVGQDAASSAPALVVIAGVVARTAEKYGDRAERYVLLEAGHAAQNLLLQAQSLGLGAVPVGGFDDDAVAAALALPAGERPYYVIPVGRPAG